MRVVLVGLGSVGRRHLQNIRAVEPAAEILVVRHARSDEPIPQEANRIVYSLEEGVDAKADVAFICGPTTMHVRAGVALAGGGAHLFVEKPLAADSLSASMLVDAARRAERLLIVGYNLRFLPSLRALRDDLNDGSIGRPMTIRADVGQYLPDWRPGSDYRKSNSARSKYGGSVELELSHEIDYARWLFGEVGSVDALLARLGDLEIEVDDTAEILMRFRSGAFGNLHLDMTQRAPVRSCRIAGTDGTLAWDGILGEVRRYRDGRWASIYSGGDGDRNDMYMAEARHVFACVRGDTLPLVNGEDGLRAVQVAEAARLASREGRRVKL